MPYLHSEEEEGYTNKQTNKISLKYYLRDVLERVFDKLSFAKASSASPKTTTCNEAVLKIPTSKELFNHILLVTKV